MSYCSVSLVTVVLLDLLAVFSITSFYCNHIINFLLLFIVIISVSKIFFLYLRIDFILSEAYLLNYYSITAFIDYIFSIITVYCDYIIN